MEHLPETTGNLEAALAYAAKGYRSIPCWPGTKIAAVKWKPFQTEEPTEDQYHEWFAGTENNLALVCGDLVVVDVDNPNRVDFVLENCGKTPSMSRSPRGGFHLPYRARKGVPLSNQVKVRGMDIDLRVAGGYSVEAGSRDAEGKPYVWLQELLPLEELPVFRVTWARERKRQQVVPLGPERVISCTAHAVREITNPEAYVLKIQSVQGSNGSAALVRAVAILRDAGRSPQEAFAFLNGVWNFRCSVPPWSEGEILHAVKRLYGIS